MGCRKGLSQPGIEFVSGIGGLASDLKNQLQRSQASSRSIILQIPIDTAIVLAGLDSMEHF